MTCLIVTLRLGRICLRRLGLGAFEELAVEGQSWKIMRIAAGYGECWGKTSTYQVCGSSFLLQERKRESF